METDARPLRHAALRTGHGADHVERRDNFSCPGERTKINQLNLLTKARRPALRKGRLGLHPEAREEVVVGVLGGRHGSTKRRQRPRRRRDGRVSRRRLVVPAVAQDVVEVVVRVPGVARVEGGRPRRRRGRRRGFGFRRGPPRRGPRGRGPARAGACVLLRCLCRWRGGPVDGTLLLPNLSVLSRWW